jgi:ribonuclease BN (tRNA processing enzyme)
VVSVERFTLGPFEVQASLVCHPGPTVGFRIREAAAGDEGQPKGAVLAYLPDHEPALGSVDFPNEPDWTSGFELAADADLLIHDAQYADAEYADRVGWGHSGLPDVAAFAATARARKLVPFHYDPSHGDAELDRRFAALRRKPLPFELLPATEGATFEL